MTERISREKMLLSIAEIVSQRGTCKRLKVGVVIAREGRIISMGYNGSPSGLPHCGPPHCDTLGTCTWSTHGEINAITYAARMGIRTEGAVMYTTDSPCEACAKAIINAGLSEVVYLREYRIITGLDLLTAANIAHRSFKL